jgi:hypothetical protein
MYSVKGTKDIELNYNTSSIRKISDTDYQYHGKPNSPNLVLSNGIKRVSYVAERIEIKKGNPNELLVHHTATSNFPKKAIVIFPLVVSSGNISEIDRLMGMTINETLDLDIGSEMTDFTMETNETQTNVYVIRLSSGLPISNNITEEPIIEGACNKLEQSTIKTFNDHIQNEQKHLPLSQTDFANMFNTYSSSDAGKNHFNNLLSSKLGSGSGTHGANGTSGIAQNQEMECFPNEGGVFNLKFHIMYDNSNTEQFIAENGVQILQEDIYRSSNNKTLRNALNAEVKNLKQHIEKLGGIYKRDTLTGTDGIVFATVNNNYKHVDTTSGSITTKFVDLFAKNKIDIVITYLSKSNDGKRKIRRFDSITGEAVSGDKPLTKENQVKDAILVAIRTTGNNYKLMNVRKFSEDYLNKDFNRYTHISIPGYMTSRENQSMKAIMVVLTLTISAFISYYTVPGVYKIAIKKITANSKECTIDKNDPFDNYYMAKAFNYIFVICTIIMPLVVMLSTGINGILSLIMTIGIIMVATIITRYKNDEMFFYSFYPRNGYKMCNETKEFRENGSNIRTFTYIPAALSAFISR